MSRISPRGHAIPWLVFLVMLALTVGLGVWQMQRKAWKDALVETIEKRATGAPTPVGDIPRSATNALGDNEFRRVVIRGRFIHACEFHLFTPMRNGAGWAIITAFQREGDAVPRDLIIRGLAPDPVRAPAKRMAGQVDGVVELTGRLRADHLKASFVPPNEPVRNNWYSRDMAAMAAAGCGGMPMTAAAGAPAFFIEYDGVAPSGGWPKPEPDAVQLRNDHLQYAITWFSLAGVLIGMFAYWLSVQRREKALARAGTGS